MEEVIRKKINIDKSRSHAPGFLPYYQYGSDAGITHIVGDDGDGNWGGFPMDLCIGRCEVIEEDLMEILGITDDSNTPETPAESTSEEPDKNTKYKIKQNLEIYQSTSGAGLYSQYYRLKYCDLLMRYNETQKIISNSVLCRAIEKRDGDVTRLILTTNFTKYCDTDEGGHCVYDYIPISASAVAQYDNTLRLLDESGIIKGNLYMVMGDYDTYKRNEEWFSSVAEKWNEAFDGIINAEGGNFSFCKWVEKNVIGKVCVPDNIIGLKVPNYVYYVEINRYKKWFEDNIKSEAETIGEPVELVNEFHNRGGEDFYEFLNNIEFRFITDTNAGADFSLTYATPYIAVPISLEDVHEYGGLYETYEYSYDENTGEYVNVCQEFSGYGEDIITWIDGDEIGDVYVDSKLASVIDDRATEVDDIVGVWGEFSNINLFKCVYHTENSKTTGKTETVYTYSGTTLESSVLESVVSTSIETEQSPNTKSNGNKLYRIVWERSENKGDGIKDEDIRDPQKGTWVTDAENNTSAQTLTATTWYTYDWWECTKLSEDETYGIECADGEDVDKNQEDPPRYRSITLLNEFPYLIDETELGNNDYYYFMVKKENGPHDYDGNGEIPVTSQAKNLSFFEIPYSANTFHNLQETDQKNIYVGDYVESVTETGGEWKVVYWLGAEVNVPNDGRLNREDKTGCRYEEIYPFETGVTNVFMDGLGSAEVYYKKILNEKTKITAYSDDFRLSRKANRAKLTGLSTGGLLVSGNTISAPVFTRDGSEMFQDAPKEVADVMIDRGTAAAFEKHFKLSECNTFEDLKNYGNNYYNL